MNGTISVWKSDRGFGFIRSAERSENTFFHISSVPFQSQQSIRVGLRCTFEMERLADGRERAKWVELVDRDDD
jgi:cold shock CspA family protein